VKSLNTLIQKFSIYDLYSDQVKTFLHARAFKILLVSFLCAAKLVKIEDFKSILLAQPYPARIFVSYAQPSLLKSKILKAYCLRSLARILTALDHGN